MPKFILGLIWILLLIGCAAPRGVVHSGKVTPKGEITIGADLSYNVPLATADALFGSLEQGIKGLLSEDTLFVDDNLNASIRSMTLYSIDPLALSTDFYLRYGVWNDLEVGYMRSGGVNVWELYYQFLGINALADSLKPDTWNGSLGIRYSSQEYELPSVLGQLQSALGYQLKRTDLLFPVIFSRSFGQGEKYGSISAGALYGISFLKYDFEPNVVYDVVAGETEVVNDVPRGENTVNSYGIMTNLKLGVSPFYVIIGLSSYYQDYGVYHLFMDQQEEFSGFTFIPSVGAQFVF
jgi:hypothetical protein